MKTESVTITLEEAKRLFLAKQHLVGNKVVEDFKTQFASVIRDVGYIQWDPVTVVAPSHMISLWSRIGNFDWAELDKLMWEEKSIFLHWIPTAWLVPTEDYPIYYTLMMNYPESLGKGWSSHIIRAKKFLESHNRLKEQVLEKLTEGPAKIKQFADYGKRGKSEDGWSPGNEVTTMLHHLHMMGEVMVSGHLGNQNLWSRTSDFLPDTAVKEEMPPKELERTTAVRALRALGIATEFDINRYFVRGRYWYLKETLEELENEQEILKVEIEEGKKRPQYFIREEDTRLLDSIEHLDWDGNLRLISPFDNIITIRERAKRLFNFEYTLEQFFPEEKRKFGTYVLPVLWRDHLAGRIDVKLDKKKGVLNVNAVYAEPGFETDLEIPEKLNETLKEFSAFLGAEKVVIGDKSPVKWKGHLGS